MSIWYDQPVSDRVRAMRYYAQQRRDALPRILASYESSNWKGYQTNRAIREADNLDALADEMERTAKVIA